MLRERTNAQGQLAGLARSHIINKQKAADEVVAWAAKQSAYAKAIRPGPVTLRAAATLVRPAAERDPEYMDRQWKSLRNAMEREQQSCYRPSDEAMLAYWITRAAKLTAVERIAALDGKPPRDVASRYGSDAGPRVRARTGATPLAVRIRRPTMATAAGVVPGRDRACRQAGCAGRQ